MNPHCSNQPAASALPPEPVPMKQWTVGVINSLRSRGGDDNKRNVDKIVCSREYMSCALTIAHSLADQLCTVEMERGYKQKSSSQPNCNNGNPPPTIETSERSWSESISVYCPKTKASEGKKDEVSDANFEPLPYEGDNLEPEDFQHLERQLSTLLFDNDNKQPVDYLDVRGAILNGVAVHAKSLSDNGKLQIRSLGIAFCELFSGGQFTADAGIMSHQQLSTPVSSGRPTQSPFLPLGQTAAELQMRSDEIGFESIDTIGGGLFPLPDAIGGGGDDFFGCRNGNNFDSNNDDGDGDGAELHLDDMSAFGMSEGNPTKRRSQSNNNLDNLSQRTVVRTLSMASTSLEPLKLLGLPTALCDLISNMIDCVVTHGGIGEAYGFISEVRDDLKLMIDCPNLYLEDVDLTKAVNVGLQFGISLYGREAELQTLKECYQRSTSSECEVAMICGTSGIGKSKLSQEFARFVSEDGESIFLSGRFDKLESQPLHAISSAFDAYCYCAWVTVEYQSMAEKVSTALRRNLGEELACLVTAMPNLANILGDDFKSNQSNKSNNAVDAQKRLRYLFCQFVDVILRCHEGPLILFLDDCQWIDNASIVLLNQILMMTGSAKDHRFFFFGTCRDDEMGESHPLNLMLTNVNSLCGTRTTKICLTSMSKSALNEMVSTELSLLPRITRPLANILHHKTKGGPLFVQQLMMELYKQRLLYPSLSCRRWVWEADKILEMKIPENVATFIMHSFDRLPFEVLSALVVMSCFGASADISLMEVLEREINQALIAPLDEAVAHSVLGKRSGEFYFMHDKLHEAAYSKMNSQERCLHHNRYGLALGFVAARERDDILLLTAVGQINHGGPQAVIDDEQAVVVANLNLDAGKIAMNMSDFFLAHSFFNYGISYLRRGHWDEHYHLSLELFNLAAKCALMNAEHDSVKTITEQIMRNAKCFGDKFEAISVTITLLNWSGNVFAAVALIHSSLSTLKEELPSVAFIIDQYLGNMRAQLAVLSDDTLLSYPAMLNPSNSKFLAVELLAKLYTSLTVIRERDAMPIIPLKIIEISLTCGMSPHSPSAFAQYGNYLALIRYEFEEGYRYVKLALSLMKKIPSRAHDGSIMFFSNHTKLYVEPMQSSIECYLDARKASLKSGNPYANACAYVYNNLCLWSGKELNAVVIAMKEARKETKYHKNFGVLALMQPMLRIALRLMGQSDAPATQQDNLTNDFDEICNDGGNTGKYAIQSHTIFFVRLSEALIFRELDKAMEAAEKYFSVNESVGRYFTISTPNMFFRRFYSGLVSFWAARETNVNKESERWRKRGVDCKDEIEKLSFSASTWNFQNKAYLLQAEEQFCTRNYEMAETLYDAAISSSKTHKFVNEEALSNELAGHFYLETGRRNKSVHYLTRAFEKYNEWGAVAKANSLMLYLDVNER